MDICVDYGCAIALESVLHCELRRAESNKVSKIHENEQQQEVYLDGKTRNITCNLNGDGEGQVRVEEVGCKAFCSWLCRGERTGEVACHITV